MADNWEFYDEGWNAFVRGDDYQAGASLDWRDGWKDARCAGATEVFPEFREDFRQEPV